MSNKEFNKGDTVRYELGNSSCTAEVLEVGEWSSGGIRLNLKWIDGPSKGKTEYLGTRFLTVIEKAKPAVPTPKFKVGDKVAYSPFANSFKWIGTVVEVCVDKFKYEDEICTGYRIDYIYEGAMKNSGWMSDGLLSLVEQAKPVESDLPTVKSAVQALTELEKKILEQIQEYNKTYGVVVSDINLRSYSSLTVSGQRDRYFSVEIEVKL